MSKHNHFDNTVDDEKFVADTTAETSDQETVETTDDLTTEAVEHTGVLAHIVKEEDGYHLINLSDGKKSDVLKTCDEGATLVLPKNDSNRKWLRIAKADIEIAEKGFAELTYKASKHFGPVGRRIPQEKLLAYLSEDEANEVKAIINRAYDRMEAEKAQNVPVTDIDKVKAKIKKLQEQLEAAEKAAVEANND